jgi:hypothetical protein
MRKVLLARSILLVWILNRVCVISHRLTHWLVVLLWRVLIGEVLVVGIVLLCVSIHIAHQTRKLLIL